MDSTSGHLPYPPWTSYVNVPQDRVIVLLSLCDLRQPPKSHVHRFFGEHHREQQRVLRNKQPGHAADVTQPKLRGDSPQLDQLLPDGLEPSGTIGGIRDTIQ